VASQVSNDPRLVPVNGFTGSGFARFRVTYHNRVTEDVEFQLIEMPEADVSELLFQSLLVAWADNPRHADLGFLMCETAEGHEIVVSKKGLCLEVARQAREQARVALGADA
jgi:hypothetical protein